MSRNDQLQALMEEYKSCTETKKKRTQGDSDQGDSGVPLFSS